MKCYRLFCRVREQHTLCQRAQSPLLIKAAPVWRGVLYNPCGFLQQRNCWTMKKNISAPLKVWLFLFKQYNTRFRTYCWHSNISASKKLWEMSNLWSYGWLVEGFFPPFSKPLSKTEPLESFWLRPSKAEGSCIPHFPWDLMKYTASGLLSIWSFRLLNQWKKDPSCHKRHMFGVTCCSGVLMPVVDIISTPYTLITIHSVQTLQSALRQTVF